MRQLREQQLHQVFGQAAGEARTVNAAAVEPADVVQGVIEADDAGAQVVDADIKDHRLAQAAAEQALQLRLQGITVDTQDQVAALAIGDDAALRERRGNAQVARLHRRAAPPVGHFAVPLQGNAEQVLIGNVADGDLHRRAIAQVEQRRIAEKHPVEPSVDGLVTQHVEAVRAQVLADLVLDLAVIGRTEQAVPFQQVYVIQHQGFS
ncbi:hypothetical protein D3C80_1061500 [compost metagenome]